MKKSWRICSKKADFYGLAQRLGIDPLTVRLMRNRDVEGEEAIRAFLQGSLSDLADPALLKDAVKAADLIWEVIREGGLIAIASDYDNDGVFSGEILKEAIIGLGGRTRIFTPNRVTEGYGLNLRIVEEAAEAGAAMILTCDNGIAAFDPIAEAKRRGMLVVVTDHHEVVYREKDGVREYVLPEADAIVDAWQADCAYPFKKMCGAGVACRLMELLYRRLGRPFERQDIYLQYAAIATVADVMELTGENRILVKEGLKRLHKTTHTGLLALMEECGIAPEVLNAYHIGFVIGPCFNAAGRLETAEPAFVLLQEQDPARAKEQAAALRELNEERKAMTFDGIEQANAVIESAPWRDEPVLLVYIPGIHESVAGIIAGRLREKYYKPTLVFTDTEGDGLIKASGRSIEAYDMFDRLNRHREMFLKFGGHKMAAGLTMKKELLEELRSILNAECGLGEKELTPVLMLDSLLPLSYITDGLIRELGLLEPFGRGNEKPVFGARHLKVHRITRIGKDAGSLKMLVEEDGRRVDCLYFSGADDFLGFLKDEFGEDNVACAMRGLPNTIDFAAAYYPQINQFNGRIAIQIVMQDYCRV